MAIIIVVIIIIVKMVDAFCVGFYLGNINAFLRISSPNRYDLDKSHLYASHPHHSHSS